MLVIIKDLQKYHPEILGHYISLHVKSIDSSRLVNGILYKQYYITSIRIAMAEKKDRTTKAIRLSLKDRQQSLAMINLVLDAISNYEKDNKCL